MPANPYAPPHQEDAPHHSLWPLLLFVGIGVGACSLCFVLVGMTVAFASAAVTIVAYFCIGRIGERPAGFAKITIADLVVLLAILGIGWGLTLPAVSSIGRRRYRQVPVESVVGNSAVDNDETVDDAQRETSLP